MALAGEQGVESAGEDEHESDWLESEREWCLRFVGIGSRRLCKL